MKVLGLRTTVYQVGNIEEAKKWYSKAFGSQPYFDEKMYVGFNVAGYELGLIPEQNPAEIKSEGVLTYWGVENVQEEYQRLLDLGATEFEKPHNVGGELIVGGVKDLWGNVIGLIYNPYFKL